MPKDDAFLAKILKLQEDELEITKAEAENYMMDREKLWELLTIFRAWFLTRGEKLNSILHEQDKYISLHYVFDLMRDFGSPLSEVELYIIYEVVTHYGNRTFTFENLMALFDSIKAGQIRTKGMGLGTIKSKYVTVSVLTINGSIPYNPLNMNLMVHENTNAQQNINLIKTQFDWPSREIKLYLDADHEHVLNDDIQLKDIIEKKSGEGIELFMDYTVGYIDNPLVLCDYYFCDRTIDKT